MFVCLIAMPVMSDIGDPGEDCETPYTISIPGYDEGTLDGFINNMGQVGPDVYYLLQTAVDCTNVTICLNTSETWGHMDTYLYLLASDCLNILYFDDDTYCDVLCNGEGPDQYNSSLLIPNLPAGTYYIVVDVFSWSTPGPYCLTVEGDCYIPDPSNCQVFPDTICPDDPAEVTLSATSPLEIHWFEGECGDTDPIGVGQSFILENHPSVSTEYFARSWTGSQYSENCCSVMLNVHPETIVTCPDDFPICIDADPVELTGASPTSPGTGYYYGLGVTADIFYPADAGVGTHTINYEYTDENFCSFSCEFLITVNPLPICDIDAPVSVVEGTTATVSVADAGLNAVYEWVVTGNATITSSEPYGNIIQIVAGALSGGSSISINLTVTDENL